MLVLCIMCHMLIQIGVWIHLPYFWFPSAKSEMAWYCVPGRSSLYHFFFKTKTLEMSPVNWKKSVVLFLWIKKKLLIGSNTLGRCQKLLPLFIKIKVLYNDSSLFFVAQIEIFRYTIRPFSKGSVILVKQFWDRLHWVSQSVLHLPTNTGGVKV